MKRRAFTRRRRYKRGRDTIKKVRRTVKKLQKQVETKAMITKTGPNLLLTSTNGHLSLGVNPDQLSNQGIGSFQMLGGKYMGVGIKVKMHIRHISEPTTGDATPHFGSAIRVVALWLKGSGYNITPGSSTFVDYFQTVDSFTNPIVRWLAPLRSQMKQNVKVLWDKTYVFGPNKNNSGLGGAVIAGRQEMFKEWYKRTPWPVEVSEVNGVTTGRLLMWWIPEDANVFQLSCSYKFYYRDP